MADFKPTAPDETVNLARKLRRPEFEKFYTQQALTAYAATRRVNVRPPHLPVMLADPIDWHQNPYGDVTWQLYFYALSWTHIICYGCDHGSEEQSPDEWLSLLRRVVMSCVDFTLSRDVDLKNREWDDHASAYRCSHFAYFYAAHLHGQLSQDEQERFVNAMARHVEVLVGFIDSGRWTDSNHLLFHVEGIADAWALFRHRIDGLDAAMDKAVAAVQHFMADAFSEDGTSIEHAGYYQPFLMQRVFETVSFFSRLGRPLDASVMERIRRGAVFLWSTMPRWPVLPNFGDTQYEKSVALSLIAPFMTNEWMVPELKQWLDDSAPLEPPSLRSYRDNGYHIFRNRPATDPKALYSLFLERPFRGPHGHWDGSSFMMWYGGVPFLIDSGGPYKYGDKLRYEYFQSQIAHNTVIFDRKNAKYKTEVIRTMSEGAFRFAVAVATFENKHQWIRVFGHYLEDTVFCVDIAWPAYEIDPVALFHIAPEAEIRAGSHTFGLVRDGVTCRATFANPAGPLPLRRLQPKDTFESRVTRVDVTFERSGLIPRVLQPGVPGLSVFSFVEDRAGRCVLAGDILSIEIQTAAGVATLDIPGMDILAAVEVPASAGSEEAPAKRA